MNEQKINRSKFFWNVSRKVCFLAITGTTLCFALLTYINWQVEKERIYQIVIDNAVIKTELLASQIVGGVRWKKPEAIWRPFNSLKANNSISNFNIHVFDNSGNQLIEHEELKQHNNAWDISVFLSQDEVKTEYIKNHDNTLTVITPIKNTRDTIFGTLVMGWSLEQAENYQQQSLLEELYVFLAFTIISVSFLFLIINKKVGKVLKQLSHEMVLVTENKHKPGSDLLSRKDEFGLMANALEVFKKNTDNLKKIEEKLIEKTLQLESTLQKELKQNALQRDFISMTSHEFRTPLAIIDSSVQRIERRMDKLDKEQLQRRIHKIKVATQRMLTLIDSTLSASRIEAGEVEIELGPVDLAGLVAQLCISHDDIADKHTITYNVEQLPRNMIADFSKLSQVFTNLLSNAIKYSPDASEVIVNGFLENNRATITIQDFGIGISQEDWDNIFERYYRSSNTTGISGTGIGLCLVQTLLELQGGVISVESEVNQGSTFKVQMPVNPPGDKTAEIIEVPLSSQKNKPSLDDIMDAL
ncbi:HAMP domain-containing sensor histidine kinase [Kiloniella litopenaei]|uniref:HAMP domain-containing sensor histidine kinase n=1 Tax=Kiloniella litopenaei TaxID=1549748 RepID=UPI000695E284|nr:HAMP domain-containing sensor histidine kinase [Kiloniella litopenaei]